MNEGRVLFTDESRFSLSSDSHRILHLERAGKPQSSLEHQLKGTGMEVAVFSLGEASCLVVVQTFTSSTQVQSTGPVIVTRFFFHMCVFLEALWVCSSLFMDDNAPLIAQRCRTALESEDIKRMDWPALISGSQSHRACMGFSRQTLGSSYLTTSIRFGSFDWRCKTNGQQCLNNSLTPSFLSMGRRCETCLAVRRSYPLLKTGCFLLDTHHRDVSAFSPHCAPCYF
ncbi:hypothetical protein TNCV_4953841, partial [Trichonephila clavipes]